MILRRNRHLCLSFVCFLLIIGARYCVTELFLALGKALLLLLATSLLLFLVTRSGDICRRLTDCLRTLSSALLRPAPAAAPRIDLAPRLSLIRKPAQPFRFQLPPPALA
jgi:hypothetical protein